MSNTEIASQDLFFVDCNDNTKIVIPEYYAVYKHEDLQNGKSQVTFGQVNSNKIVLEVDCECLDLISFLRKSVSVEELARLTNKPIHNIKKIVSNLSQAGLVYQTRKCPAQMERYHRHLLYFHSVGLDPIKAQNRVMQTRIALWGVGGIGNWVSAGLVGSGLKEIRLFDFDTVELTNLTRQVLFTESDIGESKIKIAAEQLSRRNSDTKITAHSVNIDGIDSVYDKMQDIDLLVLSADKPREIHAWAEEVCTKLNIPHITVGYTDGIGIVGPMNIPNETSCYYCGRTPEKDANRSISRFQSKMNSAYQAPSFGPVNSIVSSIAVAEIYKLICEFGEVKTKEKMLNIDIRNMTPVYAPKAKDSNCIHCASE